MECLNVHEHDIKIYFYDFDKEKIVNLIELKRNCKSKLINEDSDKLYALKCNSCKNLSYDYNSSYNLNNELYSLFYNKNSKQKYSYTNVECFEFVKCCNFILIGTKNDIISYISQEYNELLDKFNKSENRINELNLTNNAKERSIKKYKNYLEKEKSEIEKIKNEYNNIKNERNALDTNLKKERSVTSELNLKMNQLNLEQQSLKKEIKVLNTNLSSEKSQNKELKNKLDNISTQNNENVKKVLEQVENEKLINKNLGSKISELEKKEKNQLQKNEELQNEIKQKEKEIQNLTNNNINLGSNVENLKKNLNLKEIAIKEVNDSLKKEKNINQDISKNLISEKEKNKKLNDKLDNIASENNENMKKILEQLQNEKESNQDLKSKNIELEEQKQLKHKEKEELESQLKKKDEELQNVIKNYIPENFGLKFESDSKTGEYDIVLDITSFKSLINGGWLVKYNKEEGKKKYLSKKDVKTIVVGVIGNGNKGKSFFLEKLSGYEIPKGFNVKTEGLSIRYGTSKEHNVAILDSAGQETPLLKMEKNNLIKGNTLEDNNFKENGETPVGEEDNKCNTANAKVEHDNEKKLDENKNEEKKEENKNEDKDKNQEQKKENVEDEKNIEFEQYSRDKLITEFFLQKFIIWKSDVLILVVGNISLTEQKLLLRVKKEVKNLGSNKEIFVIHNLKDYSTEEQVNDYIENTLKKLYKIELEENNQQILTDDNKYHDDNYFNKYFIEKGEKVSHFIFVNEFSEKANYYNIPTIRHIQKEIEIIKTRTEFSIIDDCKQFLVKIAEEIMEENPKLENLITVEGEKYDKILLKNIKEITLKNFVVDEVGFTFSNDSNIPKHSYYINPEEKLLYINIELPGGGVIEPYVTVQGNSYYFIYEGAKNGDKAIEEDKKHDKSKLIYKKNNRKSNKFKLIITIPCSVIQIKLDDGEDLSDAGELTNDGKGVYTYKYKVMIIQKVEKKKKKQTVL